MTNKKGKAAAGGAATKPKTRSNSNRPATQKQVVLRELKRCTKKGMTAWDFITKFHITRASAYVCMLRKEGHKIDSVNEHGEGSVVYSRYFYKGGPDDVSSL